MAVTMKNAIFSDVTNSISSQRASAASYVSQLYKITSKSIVLYNLIFNFLKADKKTEVYGHNGSKHY
jgi:hypothetical protein